MVLHPVLQSAVNDIVFDGLPYEKLHSASIVVTGGTGIIGSALVHTLCAVNMQHNLKCTVSVLGRNPDKFQKMFGMHPYVRFVQEPDSHDVIFHLAAPTCNADFVQRPYDTMRSMTDMTVKLGRCLEKRQASVVFVSSMEAYGTTSDENVRESDAGLLDWMQPRSTYPECKRFSELYLRSLALQLGRNVKIVRPTLTFGNALRFNDTRVYAQFIRAVMDGRDIVLHTKGQSRRDYLYVFDLVRALLTVLLLGKSGEAYNVSNPESYCSIYDLACLVQSFGKNSKIVYDLGQSNNYAQDVKIKLDNSKLDALHKFERVSLREMIKRCILLTQEKEQGSQYVC